VRPDHAANDGQIFSWDISPPTGHPGEDYNCRCYAEPAFKDPPIEPVFIIEELLIGGVIAKGVGRIGKAVQKIFKNPISKRPKGVQKDWVKERSNKKDGYKYIDPKSKRSTDVRVQKGKPNVSNPAQQKDYVKWKKDGKWMDKDGNVVAGDSPEAHIPLEDFKFDKDLFK